jgi:glycerol-3-phosphate dehydrogenase (NAD(P)+)
MINVCLLGYGEIGKALDNVLSRNSQISLERWDKNVDILPTQRALTEIIPACDVLFVCIPTWVVRSALQSIHKLLKPETIIVSVSKGFEKETCIRVDTLFTEIIGTANPIVFLGGPMIAEELIAGTPTKAVAASTNEHARTVMKTLFANTTIGLETSDDFEGVITAASLKNIYALGLGIVDALNFGANAHGVFLAKATHEMMHVVASHGGRAESALGLAGLGDLVATTQSPNSTNYTTGIRFARGLAPLRGSEALNTLPCIMKTMASVISDLPFLRAIHDVVVDGKPAHETITRFLA